MEPQDNFRNSQSELDSAFANDDSQTVEQILNSFSELEIKSCVKTLVSWIKSYQRCDQKTCIEILLRKLKESRVQYDIEDKEGATLLMHASQKCHLDLVQALVQQGFKLNKSD